MKINKLDIGVIKHLIALLQDYKKEINEPLLVEKDILQLNQAIFNKRITFFVVTLNDEMIGMCSVSTIFSSYQCREIGIFEDFYIKPKHRSQGIAKKLVDYVFETMKLKHINTIWVGCATSDINMYQHLGFKTQLGNLLTK